MAQSKYHTPVERTIMYVVSPRVFSPITKFPRNAQCFCASCNKFKHCHGPKQDAGATMDAKKAQEWKENYPNYYKQGRSA